MFYRIEQVFSWRQRGFAMPELQLDSVRSAFLAEEDVSAGWPSGRFLREGSALGSLRPTLERTLLGARTARVGRTREGLPWGFELGRRGPAHLLICGPAGCGKSELLRTCLISLCWTTAPSALGVLAIDPSSRELGMVDRLPHALLEPVSEVRRASALLAWLADEVRLRRRSGKRGPELVLAVEALGPWSERCDLQARLGWVRRNGGPAGVHVLQIAASSSRAEPVVDGNTCIARGQGRPGEFVVSDGNGRVPVRALWLPVRDLVCCLEEIRQTTWLSGNAGAAAYAGRR